MIISGVCMGIVCGLRLCLVLYRSSRTYSKFKESHTQWFWTPRAVRLNTRVCVYLCHSHSVSTPLCFPGQGRTSQRVSVHPSLIRTPMRKSHPHNVIHTRARTLRIPLSLALYLSPRSGFPRQPRRRRRPASDARINVCVRVCVIVLRSNSAK